MRNGYGMNGGEWVAMFAVWGVLLGVIALAIARVVSSDRGGHERDGASVKREPTPGDILDARLARREVDPEAYRAVAERLSHRTGR